jgi:hypothetical protein
VSASMADVSSSCSPTSSSGSWTEKDEPSFPENQSIENQKSSP